MLETYTTFSGIDIAAIFDNTILDVGRAIAGKREIDCFGIIRHANIPIVRETRERVPEYRFGSTNANSIQRKPPPFQGFTLFDREAFYSLFLDEKVNELYYKTYERA